MNKSCRCWLSPVLAACAGIPLSLWSCGGGDDYGPPPLSYYEGRLPGRSLGRILLETGGIELPEFAVPDVSIDKIIGYIGNRPQSDVAKKIETSLEFARSHQAAKSEYALLHDLLDLTKASAVPAEDMAAYAWWRYRWDDSEPSAPDWQHQKQWKAQQDDRQARLEALIKECEAGTKPKGLLPHYLYCMGARYFHMAKDMDSEAWFMRVVKEFPDHPRAEAAMFMAARSALSQTRGSYGGGGPDANRARALKAFAEYRQRFPTGRFLGDCAGWEGALHYDGGAYLEALKCYAQQLHFPGHPELAKSAIPMCERCLRGLCAPPDDALKNTLEEVIRDPALTTALVYQVLWMPAPRAQPGGASAESKQWRQDMLHAIAKALPAAEKNFAGAAWHPRFLAILAQALSGDGHQREALAMLGRNATAGAANEDWCFAKAVVQERSDQLKEALSAYEDFVQRFPASVWLPDVLRRKAGVLKDLGQADRAIITLRDEKMPKTDRSGMIYPATDAGLAITDSALDDTLSMSNPDNRNQTLEALFYGAPVEQLAKLTAGEDLSLAEHEALKKHLARRLIAQHRYGEAATMLPLEQAEAMGLKELSGQPDTDTLLRLGKAWSAARGQWLGSLPKETKDQIDAEVAPPSIIPGIPSICDARSGLKDAIASMHYRDSDELLNYDELLHAMEFYRTAIARAPAKTKAGIEARLLALDAMPVLARTSSSALDFARRGPHDGGTRHWWQVLGSSKKNDWSSESRRWWQELQKAPGGTGSVARAVYWSFGQPTDKVDNDASADASQHWSNSRWDHDPDFIFDGLKLPKDAEANYGYSPSRIGLGFDTRKKNLLDDLAALQIAANNTDAGSLRADSVTLQAKVQAANPLAEEAFVLNALNDICATAAIPGVGDAALCRYADFRLACLSNAAWGWFNLAEHHLAHRSDDELAAKLTSLRRLPGQEMIVDFWDALEISIAANHGLNRDWLAVEKLCQEFLSKYKPSIKREAVTVHWVRAAYRARRPQKSVVLARWAKLGLEAADRSSAESQAPWDPKPALAAVAAYRKEFPQGRFSGEVDDIEGLTAWRAGNYPAALRIAAHGLAEGGDKRSFAAPLMVNILADLEKPESRAGLLKALRSTKEAHEALRTCLDEVKADSGQPPLAFMADFLREQVLGK